LPWPAKVALEQEVLKMSGDYLVIEPHQQIAFEAEEMLLALQRKPALLLDTLASAYSSVALQRDISN
jgi:hypothetical protein